MSVSLLDLLDMVPLSPTLDSDSTNSRACSPTRPPPPAPTQRRRPTTTTTTPPPQTSPLLRLPADIFSCILDYLDHDAAWSLKRLCRGMAASDAVTQLLYRYPINVSQVCDLRLGDWKYRRQGQERWRNFQQTITDANRHYIHHLALSHWASLDDFRWVEANLPALVHLDLTAIKDFVWTPEHTWTWRQLARACPTLFARLHDLDVANWADYTAHSRIEYSYAYNDYRFKPKFRLSRRRDGGSVAQELFPTCTNLKSLGIRERHSGFQELYSTWNEWEVHQRVCCLVDGIQKHCPSTLTKLRVHDYAPYRSLFATDITPWSRITNVDIGIYSWIEDRREREPMGPVPYRITAGHHHREEEEAFDDKTFESCKRNHMTLGSHVVQSVGASFEDLLHSLHAMSTKYPTIQFKPISNVENITLHPFHLVNVMQRRGFSGQTMAPAAAAQQSDPVSHHEVQAALRWLQQKCAWKPILAWDQMMCDVFPANLEANRTFLPKPDVLSRIQAMVAVLRDLDLPVRISIGDRTSLCSPGVDGSLYFGDYKTFASDGDSESDAQHELLLPTQACFNLTPIAHMIDELTIQYPSDMPSVGGWPRLGRHPSPAETALMQREKTGWRRFWARYAAQFRNLKKLTTNVPAEIYADWAHSALPDLLADGRWQMLNLTDRGGDYGFFASYFPFSLSKFTFRKRAQRLWVQRVFFRLDTLPLVLEKTLEDPAEEKSIPDSLIQDRVGDAGRFWMGEGEKREREAEEDGEDEGEVGYAAAVGVKRFKLG